MRLNQMYQDVMKGFGFPEYLLPAERDGDPEE